MIKICLPVPTLRAIALFSAKDDHRYYLNGVAIDSGHLVATNGHYLGAMPLQEVDKEIKAIIPISAIDLFLKTLSAKQKKLDCGLFLSDDLKTGALRFAEGVTDVETPFKTIDGKFVDWQNITPKHKKPIAHTVFNWEYAALFQKASDVLLFSKTITTVHIIPNGTNAARVYFPSEPEFIGVLMPIRTPKDFDVEKIPKIEV